MPEGGRQRPRPAPREGQAMLDSLWSANPQAGLLAQGAELTPPPSAPTFQLEPRESPALGKPQDWTCGHWVAPTPHAWPGQPRELPAPPWPVGTGVPSPHECHGGRGGLRNWAAPGSGGGLCPCSGRRPSWPRVWASVGSSPGLLLGHCPHETPPGPVGPGRPGPSWLCSGVPRGVPRGVPPGAPGPSLRPPTRASQAELRLQFLRVSLPLGTPVWRLFLPPSSPPPGLCSAAPSEDCPSPSPSHILCEPPPVRPQQGTRLLGETPVSGFSSGCGGGDTWPMVGVGWGDLTPAGPRQARPGVRGTGRALGPRWLRVRGLQGRDVGSGGWNVGALVWGMALPGGDARESRPLAATPAGRAASPPALGLGGPQQGPH